MTVHFVSDLRRIGYATQIKISRVQSLLLSRVHVPDHTEDKYSLLTKQIGSWLQSRKGSRRGLVRWKAHHVPLWPSCHFLICKIYKFSRLFFLSLNYRLRWNCIFWSFIDFNVSYSIPKSCPKSFLNSNKILSDLQFCKIFKNFITKKLWKYF